MTDDRGQCAPFPPSVTCPLCGGIASLKKTKNNRVSSFCSKCSSRTFLNSWPALHGFLELASQVERNREAWSREMERRAVEAQIGPSTSTVECDRVIVREHLERASRGDAGALAWVMSLSDGAQALTAFMREKARESSFRLTDAVSGQGVEVSP